MLPRTPFVRSIVLAASIAALLFDGFELGLMPVASLSVSESLLGNEYTEKAGGDWFARFTAALMLGAAIGGIALGRLGDVVGRSKALGVSILFYSVFAGIGAWVQTQEQMLVLRFLVGLGVGGVWPNAVALVSECWPDKSKPMVAGLLGAALNFGILILSQVARHWHITDESWRWIFVIAAVPAVLGVLVLIALPESPAWLALKATDDRTIAVPVSNISFFDLFRPPILQRMILGIVLGSIPLVGAWAASKWMIPWAASVSKVMLPGYKATVQGWWAVGAVLGSFFGAQIANMLGRRRSYAVFSLGATVLTLILFLMTEPMAPSFLPIVLGQAFVSTLFFGWLPLYLPELFPTAIRATGTGIAYNTGRFATAIGLFAAGALFTMLDGSYSKVGAIGASVYSLGMLAILFFPHASKKIEKPKVG